MGGLLAILAAVMVGTVRDAKTNQPLQGVLVRAQYLGNTTDEHGRFRIEQLDSGDVKIEAYRRDFVPLRKQAVLSTDGETTVDLSLDPSPPACCRLEGTWSIRLVLEKPGVGEMPKGAEAPGTVRFGPEIPDPFPERRKHKSRDDPTVDEFGVYDVDLRPILGKDITRAASNTTFPGPGSNLLREAEGSIQQESEVAINFIPRMSHGGISFSGTIAGDEIRGEWLKRDYAPTISGTFVMNRQPRP